MGQNVNENNSLGMKQDKKTSFYLVSGRKHSQQQAGREQKTTKKGWI